MSNLIHMETEQTRSMASALLQVAQSIGEQSGVLRQQVANIDWSGPSHDQFMGEIEAVLRQASSLAENGETLSLRVQREVDEWEGADASFGGGGSSSSGIAANNPVMSNQSGFTPVDPTAGLHVTEVPPLDYAYFSQAAYDDYGVPPYLAEQGWSSYGVRIEDLGIEDLKGYYGRVFINADTGQVVIAHRGTNDLLSGDVVSDAQLFMDDIPDQYAVSRQFVMAIQQKLAEDGYDYTLTHTGHSLGAVLSDLNAMKDHTRGIAFDNPGSREIIQNFGDEFGNYSSDQLISYQSAPNPVNQANPQAGYVVEINPNKSGNLEKLVGNAVVPGAGDIWQAKIRHGIDNIVNSMDPETGFPKSTSPSGGGGAW